MPGMGRSIRCEACAGDTARRTEIRIEPPLLVLPAMRNESSPGTDVGSGVPSPGANVGRHESSEISTKQLVPQTVGALR